MSGVKFNPRKIYPLPSPEEISKYLLDSPAPLRGDWEFFASGRCALNRVISEITQRGFRGRVFLPRYFCPEAARSIAKSVKVEFFEDLPLRPQSFPAGRPLGRAKKGPPKGGPFRVGRNNPLTGA